MSVKKSVNVLAHFKNSVNCFLNDGVLTPAYQSRYVMGAYPAGVYYAAYSKAVQRYFVCANGAVGVSREGHQYTNFSGFGKLPPFMIEDWDGDAARTVIISDDTAAVFSGNDLKIYFLKVGLTCGAMHCGRLFGANGYVLRWSGAGGFDDWEEGIGKSGYVILDSAHGEVLDILVFGGKLVAVREYGLTVLSMYGSPENFSVDLTDTDCDKIFKSTAKIVCGKLYFFSWSGLKCFDGNKISAVDLRHEVAKPTCSAEWEGRYFLACYSVVLNRSVILCFDAYRGESCIIDDYADAFYVNDGVFYYNAGGLHQLLEGGTFSFESALDFGTDRFKTVTKIEVSGTADIRIGNGNYTRVFSAVSGTLRPHMRGKNFVIEIEGQSEIKAVTVTAEVLNAV